MFKFKNKVECSSHLVGNFYYRV